MILVYFVKSAQADLEDRFLSEAPRAWGEMREQPLSLQGVLNYENTLVKRSDPDGLETRELSERIRREFAITGQHMRILSLTEEFRNGKSSSQERAGGMNSRYSFLLTRKERSLPFAIALMAKSTEPGNEQDLVRSGFANSLLLDLYAATNFHGKPLGTFIQSPKFNLLDVSVVRDEEQNNLVEVQFTESHPRVPILKGAMIFDASKRWRLLSWDTTMPSGRVVQTNEYHESLSDIELPKRILMRYLGDGTGRLERHKITTFTDVKKVGLPESEFTIGAFGLQEIDPYFVREPSNMWIWFLVFGITGGVIVLLVLVYLRKRQAADGSQLSKLE